MVDFNGGGGLVGLDPNGWMGNYNGFTGMTAPQINQSMGMGYGGAGDQNQAQLNNIFGNFGNQTAYYSGLGAAYGRNTGGFGGYGAANADPFTPVGGGGGLTPAASRGFPSGSVQRGPDLSQLGGLDWNGGQGIGGGGGGGMLGDIGMGNYSNPFEGYNSGGFNPFSAQTYAPSAQSNLGARAPAGGGFSRAMSAFQQPQQPQLGGLDWGGGGGSSHAQGMLGDIGMGNVGGGYDPYSPQTYAPSANFGGLGGGGGGRNSLAQILMQSNSPRPQPPPDQRLWSGNFFGASPPPNTVGNSVGMAPGFGGFGNPPNQAQDDWSQAFRHMNSNGAPGG